jgi:hypothetical protein
VGLSLSLKRDLDISLQVLWEKVLDGVKAYCVFNLGGCGHGTEQLLSLRTKPHLTVFLEQHSHLETARLELPRILSS